MSRALDDLDVRFQPIAMELIARCVESGYQIMIVDTRRTPAEHAANLATGVSWTKHSKHLDGLAIDICPYSVWQLDGADKLNWQADHPVWLKIGAVGERLGLRWGGRWKSTPDYSHFEYVLPTTVGEMV